jgi:hypothetical protein
MNLTPTDQVISLLKDAGYLRVPPPLEIAGLEFDFPAVFLGDAKSLDLVLIADMAFEDQERVLRKIEGVARSLDSVRSKRALTLVLAGPRPKGEVLEAMSRVCRVLSISAAKNEDASAALRNSLAVLMPLDILEPTAVIADPLQQVRERTKDYPPEVSALIELAPRGKDLVQAGLHAYIMKPLSPSVDAEGDLE